MSYCRRRRRQCFLKFVVRLDKEVRHSNQQQFFCSLLFWAICRRRKLLFTPVENYLIKYSTSVIESLARSRSVDVTNLDSRNTVKTCQSNRKDYVRFYWPFHSLFCVYFNAQVTKNVKRNVSVNFAAEVTNFSVVTQPLPIDLVVASCHR